MYLTIGTLLSPIIVWSYFNSSFEQVVNSAAEDFPGKNSISLTFGHSWSTLRVKLLRLHTVSMSALAKETLQSLVYDLSSHL